VLRNLEEEWGTLMFFAKDKKGSSGSDVERLAIFGKRRARRGAELKVMSAVEHKIPVRVCCSVFAVVCCSVVCAAVCSYAASAVCVRAHNHLRARRTTSFGLRSL
jgi:hypothetical protein